MNYSLSPRAFFVLKMVLLSLITGSCCGLFTCEDPLERERRELRESLESPEALIYRGLKIGLRSIPMEALQNPSVDEAQLYELMAKQKKSTQAKKVTYLTLNIIRNVTNPDTASLLKNIGLYLQVAKELYELRSELRAINEDDFPTILQNLMSVDSRTRGALELSWYQSSHEHMILAVVWIASKVAPRSFYTHEISMMDPEKIDDPMLKLGAYMLRGAAFFKEKWPHMAELEFTGYLNTLEKHQADFVQNSQAKFLAIADSSDERQLYAQLHAPGVLMRGLDRLKIEKEEEGLDDLEAFLRDAEILGMDNEPVWLIGTYVTLKREKTEQAVGYLEKLQKSPIFDSEEQALVQEAIDYLKKRDPDKAWTKVSDKVLMAKIIFSVIKSTFSKMKWYETVENSQAGRRLYHTQNELHKQYDEVMKAFSGDELMRMGEAGKSKALRLVDSLIKK